MVSYLFFTGVFNVELERLWRAYKMFPEFDKLPFHVQVIKFFQAKFFSASILDHLANRFSNDIWLNVQSKWDIGSIKTH